MIISYDYITSCYQPSNKLIEYQTQTSTSVLDNVNPNCPESSHESCDEVVQSSDSDSDTDDEYVLEEEGSMDLSEDSDDDVGEDGEDEIFHSVKRYRIFCLDLSVCVVWNILSRFVCDLIRLYLSYQTNATLINRCSIV